MNFVNYYLHISINNTLLNEFLNKILQNTIHQNIMNFVSKFQRKFRQTEIVACNFVQSFTTHKNKSQWRKKQKHKNRLNVHFIV